MSELPQSFVRNFRDSNPGYRPGQNEETDALFNPSITARPLHVPMAQRIKKHKNTEMWPYWAFDRCGQNPNHTRVEQLRAAGFEYATTEDFEMMVDDTVKGRDDKGFSAEIRNGDLRLMKVKKSIWLQIRKGHQQQALSMMNPRGKVMGEDGTIMGVNQLVPGVRTEVMDDANEMKSRAVMDPAMKDLSPDPREAVAQRLASGGNATQIAKETINKRS